MLSAGKFSKERELKMNNRERIMNILHYKPVDRWPAVHFGYWPELLCEWADKGLIPRDLAENAYDGNAADLELDRIIGWDFNWNNHERPNIKLWPTFEPQVLEVFPDGTRREISELGVVQRVKPGLVSIPSEEDYLLKDRDAFLRHYKDRMQYTDDRLDLDYFRKFNETRRWDIPIGLKLGSVLGDLRNITTVVGMSYLMYDEDEDLLADIVDTYAEMQYKCTEAILATGATFDFAQYWEDICFKTGPLFAPDKVRELCAKHYQKRNDLCHKYGIDVIALDCDGVTEALLPMWFETGVNTMFPIEVGVWGDQFVAARKKFGRGMLGVGGLEKNAFRQDRDAVDAELARVMEIAKLGGFLPCPDHRLMPGSKFELVQYYIEKIQEYQIAFVEE